MTGSSAVGIGVIGYGYWGPNVVRNFAELDGCRVVAVCDVREERRAAARRRHPLVATMAAPEELIAHPDVDAVAVATPVSTHYTLALQTLRAGKHAFVEKPLAGTAEQAAHLISAAARRNLVLMVDHTFVFSGAVRKIRDLVRHESFGRLYYYDSMRVNLGLFQHDVNVIWDLAAHDFSVMDHVVAARPCAVSATGLSPLIEGLESIAHLTVFYDEDLLAHVGVNWLAPVKVRQTLIGGSRQMIVYDDLEPSEKVKVYHKGVTVDATSNPEGLYRVLVGYRTGDMWAPQLTTTEPLRAAADHFLECIRSGTTPTTDGEAGLRVVRMLEAATQSVRRRGRPVELAAAVPA